MSINSILKTGLISSIFALGALVNPALGATSEEIKEKPTCDMDFLMKDTLRDSSILPTGQKASSSQWDMEIYANPKTAEWVLLGRSKNPQVAPTDELCQLAWGKSPYKQTVWYQKNFQGTPPQPTRVATETPPVTPPLVQTLTSKPS